MARCSGFFACMVFLSVYTGRLVAAQGGKAREHTMLPSSYSIKADIFTKPFLKWAGGKYRIISKIARYFPSVQNFVEPFSGSAAAYLAINAKQALVCDTNNDIIALYKAVQHLGSAFIPYCQSFFCPANNTQEAFCSLRARFNALPPSAERAALFLYLNRHAYNGLVRYNSKGQYNVSFGKYKKPYFPHREMCAFWKKTQETETRFLCQDFKKTFAMVPVGAHVYCDPPYVPLSATANFTSYSGSTFTLREHQELALAAQACSAAGSTVLLSNHDTALVRSLYTHARLESFDVQRSISCLGAHRHIVPELLALYPATKAG
jgi:DNA adenine methylase